MSNLRPAEISIFSDAIKDIKHWKSLIVLISADYDKTDQRLSENLAGVADHLCFALEALQGIVEQTKKT